MCKLAEMKIKMEMKIVKGFGGFLFLFLIVILLVLGFIILFCFSQYFFILRIITIPKIIDYLT